MPRRCRPETLRGVMKVRERDRMVIKELLRGQLTKTQVAEAFGIGRTTLHAIERRVFENQPSIPTLRWTRPDIRGKPGRRRRAAS